jgi:hypothetical protein
MTKPGMLLWLSDSRGQYIPRDFAKSFADRDKSVSGVKAEDWECLDIGPWNEAEDKPNDWYWEAWESVCQDATITDEKGVKYFVYQDGDCWLVPQGMQWNDENETFEWPEESED